MPYAPFSERFPEVAHRETFMFRVALHHPTLPPGPYALLEAYCDEPGCDCRRVFLHVLRAETRTLEAVIAFGWESRRFYAAWMGYAAPDVLDVLKGPALNVGSPV